MQQPSCLPPANTTRQPNAGSTLVHRRWLWPSIIQHWTVLSVSGGVSTEYMQTPIQCLLNVGPVSPVLGSIQSVIVVGSAVFSRSIFVPKWILLAYFDHLDPLN